MPLPKPPAQRAALLAPADFESQAAPKPGKRPPKTRAAAEPASPSVLDLFDELRSDGLTLMVVTHDDQVSTHADRAIHLRDGRIEVAA